MSDIFMTLSADKLLALAEYGEAASEGAQGMMAVANVILNRMQSPSAFADSSILSATGSLYHAVILKPYQFSAFNISDPVRPKLENLAKTWSSAVMTNSALSKAYEIAKTAVSGMLADNTNGADHYHTAAVHPSWSDTLTKIGQIGNHIFYRSRTIASRVIQSPYTAYAVIGIIILAGAYLMLKRR